MATDTHEKALEDLSVVPGFVNNGTETSRTLAMLTLALIGPAYFRELAALLAGAPPDAAKVAEVMGRHGLVVAAVGA